MSSLLFIDTNILLDFYRYPRGSALLSVLGHIDRNHDKIITTTQVDMEYKKNKKTGSESNCFLYKLPGL
jgi:hypothetical protein